MADERTFEAAEPTGGGVRVGHPLYRRVVVAPGCRLTEAGQRLAAGVRGVDPQADGVPVGPPVPDATLPLATPVPVEWPVEPPPTLLPLEPTEVGPHRWRATFRRDAGADGLSVSFADPVADVAVNGRPVPGDLHLPPAALTVGENVLTFRCDAAVAGEPVRPLAWVAGAVAVRTDSPFEVGPNGAARTAGPSRWALPRPARHVGPSPGRPVASDLTAHGYPFTAAPVTATAHLDVPPGTHGLALAGTAAAAARVSLGGHDCGFA